MSEGAVKASGAPDPMKDWGAYVEWCEAEANRRREARKEAQRARAAAAEQAKANGAPPAARLRYAYLGSNEGDAVEVGIYPPFRNAAGAVLIPARIGPARPVIDPDPLKHSNVDAMPAHIVQAGQTIVCSENSWLHTLLRHDTKRFRRWTGEPAEAANVGQPDDDADAVEEAAIFGSANQSSWSGVAEAADEEIPGGHSAGAWNQHER
jgi:hypothetical protein